MGEQILDEANSLRLLVATGRGQIHIGSALDFAWSTYRRRWRLFVGVLGAMLGAWVVLEIVVVTTQRLGILVWALAHITFLFCFAGMEVGLLRISLMLQDTRNPTLADALKDFDLGPRFLAGQVLYMAMVLVGVVLLIVPGFLLGARFAFFGFQTAAKDGGVLRSFMQSWELTRGATGRLAATLGVLFAFNLLGAALLGLGLLVTVPLSVLTMAAIRRQLVAAAPIVDA